MEKLFSKANNYLRKLLKGKGHNLGSSESWMFLNNIHDKQATQKFSPTFISLDIKNPPWYRL